MQPIIAPSVLAPDFANLPAVGIYFYTLENNGIVLQKNKLVYVK